MLAFSRALQAAVLFASVFIFVFANVVKMQPWNRDNVKMFYIWLFVAAGFNALYLISPFLDALAGTADGKKSDKPAPPQQKAMLIVVPLALVLMTFTGFLSYVRETGHHHILYGQDEIAVRVAQRVCFHPMFCFLTGFDFRRCAALHVQRIVRSSQRKCPFCCWDAR